MDKKTTLRDLIENESFLRDYFHEAIKNSLPKTRMYRYALNVLGIQHLLNLIIKTEGAAWYDATLEQAEPEDFGEVVRFVFYIHGENKDEYIGFNVPKPKKYSLTEKVRLIDLPRLFSRGDSDV